MPRSQKKYPFIHHSIRKKVERMLANNEMNKPIKTYCRSSFIAPFMVGFTFLVHNGKTFVPVVVGPEHVGHKLGEFSLTRVFKGHPGDKKS